jgi:hypothetical protein
MTAPRLGGPLLAGLAAGGGGLAEAPVSVTVRGLTHTKGPQ